MSTLAGGIHHRRTTAISLTDTGCRVGVVDRMIVDMIPAIQRERSLGDNQLQDRNTRDVAPVREIKAADVEETDYGEGALAVKATCTLVSLNNLLCPSAIDGNLSIGVTSGVETFSTEYTIFESTSEAFRCQEFA